MELFEKYLHVFGSYVPLIPTYLSQWFGKLRSISFLFASFYILTPFITYGDSSGAFPELLCTSISAFFRGRFEWE